MGSHSSQFEDLIGDLWIELRRRDLGALLPCRIGKPAAERVKPVVHLEIQPTTIAMNLLTTLVAHA